MNRKHLSLLLLLLLGLGMMPKAIAAVTADNQESLVNDGGFENQGDTWITCGGATLIDRQNAETPAQMVYAGRYALRMGQPIDDSCGNDALGPTQIAAEDITIPSDAQDVTLSFWYSAVGDWPAGELSVQLSTKPTNYLGGQAMISTLKMDALMPGWQLFRQNVTADQLAAIRGQTLYLTFWVQSQGQPDWNWAIYLDEVSVTPHWERTQATSLPSALRGDGERPLLVMGYGETTDTFGIQRMDTDGGNRVIIAESILQPNDLTWSPDGERIAYETGRPFPDAPSDDNHFQALVSDIQVINADGTGGRTPFYTIGVEGQKEQPRGCLRTNSCADSGRNAVDATVQDIAWSPDGTQILATLCTEARWYNADKVSTGCSYYLVLHPLPNTPESVNITLPKWIDVAQNGSWATNNQLIFERPGSVGTDELPAGVWEADLNQQSPQPQLVQTWLTGYAGSNTIDLRPSPEREPTWAPDRRHFVTYRPAQGVRYVEKIPNDVSFLALRTNYTIMLHDRKDPAATRQLLYVDQGTLIGRPTWSPDGRYLLYVVLADIGDAADIWWLDVSTGATGKVTNDGVSYEVDWLPTHDFVSAPTPGPTATRNPALTQNVYLPEVLDSSNVTAQPTVTLGVPVSFPTLTPMPTATPLPTPVNPTPVPPRGIRGFVTYQGTPVEGITIQLETCLVGGSCEIRERTTTDAAGQYNFPAAPTYNGAFGYQVTYRNGPEGDNPLDERYLLIWQEPMILDYDYAQRVEGGNFDIANVALSSPADNAVIPSPATFTWQARGIQGEQYQWFIDATADSGLCDQQEPGTNTSFTFTGLDCSIFPELSPNEPYLWYVLVHGESGGIGQSQTRTVTFTE